MKRNGTAAKHPAKHTIGDSSSADHGSKLEEFLHEELKDIYWAEKHLVKTLPKMQENACSPELQQAFGEHLEQTKEHVARLENVFELLGHKPEAKKCDGMDGLTKEGEHIVEETEDGTATRDVGLILAAQKVEHYEIATYGTLSRLARLIGKNDVAELLEKTLGEEKVTDMNLTQIAENHVNYESSKEEQEA
jgi:ferritin-like metal-binding protein YciE